MNDQGKNPKLICFDVVMVGAPPPLHRKAVFYAMDDEGIIYLYEDTTGRWEQTIKGWF
jgi:hypothetical protein